MNDQASDNSGPSGLLRSTGVVSFFTLMSRVLGLVRDVVLASFFGATAGADAFLVAFKIPNFMRRLFAEGAFAQAFIPVLSEYKTQRSHDAVRDLVNRVCGSLGTALLSLTVFAVIFAPWIIMLFAPGFVQFADKIALSGELLRITFPYLMLISLTAFAGSILNTYGHFAIPAFAPVLLNVSLIAAALLFSHYFSQPVTALAWGVFIAGLLQLMIHLPPLARRDLLPRPKMDWQDEGVRRILTLMLPALFGVSVSQINLMLDTILASFLESGSVSWLYYSDRLVELPLGVFGIAIATAILPQLSKIHANADGEGFSRTLDWALKSVIVIGLPAAVALLVLGSGIITTLFQYNQFTAYDVAMSSKSLSAYALGVLAFMLIKVLAPGYFARQDTKTPVKIAIKAMLANMVLNLLLVFSLAHAGLALATSLSACLNAGLLLLGLIQQKVYKPGKGWWAFWIKTLTATTFMAALLVYFNPSVEIWLARGAWERIGSLLQLVIIGSFAYFGVLGIMGVRLRHFKQQQL